jgi:hypothetical protein
MARFERQHGLFCPEGLGSEAASASRDTDFWQPAHLVRPSDTFHGA